MKVIILCCLMSFGVSANDTFLQLIKNEEIKLAFNDGDVHTVTFTENQFGIVTGNYEDERGKKVVGMPITFVEEEGVEYMRLYKDRRSPAGTYKYAMRVFIPTDLESGKSRAYVDARWGYFLKPLIFI